jgi:hypothetical protein
VFIPLLRCTDFDIVQLLPTSAIDIQDKPPNIQVGHYGRPTVTWAPSSSAPSSLLPPPHLPPPTGPVSPPQRVDDEEQEVITMISDDADFPSLVPPACPNRHARGNTSNINTLAWNSLVPGALALAQRNPGSGHVRVAPVFASIITAKGFGGHLAAADKAKQARDIQKRNPSRRFKPGHSMAPSSFTDLVVMRNGGVADQEAEMTFRRKNPVDIVQAAQRVLNKASQNPPIILRGCWAESVAKTGNFVYRIVGELSTASILACKEQLCDPFPEGEVWIVPTKGWTWVQLWGVDVSYLEDDVQFIYKDSQLMEAFIANPCFQGVDIMVPPHFQGNPANFKLATATVIAAISDADNTRCQRASSEGVCMFGQQVKFVRAGDNPSLVQCSRCHEISHYFSSPKCRVGAGAHCCTCSKVCV